MAIVLGSITLVASAAVGGIYLLTQEPIEVSQAAKINDAIAQVVGGKEAFDNAPAKEAVKIPLAGDSTAVPDPTLRETKIDSLTIYPATKAGQPVGYAVETFSNSGFGGRMSLMVGFLPDGTIQDISVISHGETPGLGDKIQRNKSDFSVQFQGKNPASFRLKVKKDGGDVDAITASTISSRAFTGAVQQAYDVLQAYLTNTSVQATSGATATSWATTQAESDEQKATARKPQQEQEDEFEFDPRAVKGALPYDASTGATSTTEEEAEAANNEIDDTNTQKGGE